MPVSFPQKLSTWAWDTSCSGGPRTENHLCPEIQECLGQQDRVEGIKFLKTVVLRTKIWFSTHVIIFEDKPVWCEFLAAKWRCGHEEADTKPQTHIVPWLLQDIKKATAWTSLPTLLPQGHLVTYGREKLSELAAFGPARLLHSTALAAPTAWLLSHHVAVFL